MRRKRRSGLAASARRALGTAAKRAIVLCAVTLVVASAAAAASPANDNRSAAQPIGALPASAVGTTVDATLEAADPKTSRCGAFDANVWYRINSAPDSRLAVRVDARGDLDAVLVVYEAAQTLLEVECDQTDRNGLASLTFDARRGATYLLMVGPRPGSSPGDFDLRLNALTPPPNDRRGGAPALHVPTSVTGTTVGATRETTDPPTCGTNDATVWYRLEPRSAGRVVLRLRALGDLDAAISVHRRIRSQLEPVACRRTDRNGRADVAFDVEKDGRYLIEVGQVGDSESGSFQLSTLAPEAIEAPPGKQLAQRPVVATLNAFTDHQDTWSAQLEAGTTYRINFVSNGCARLQLFAPGTRMLREEEPILEGGCEVFRTFTPGPDGGGRYVLQVLAGQEGTRPYRVQVVRAGPDDTAPGREVRSPGTVRGRLSMTSVDAMDLYRFEVVRPSDVNLRLGSTRQFPLRLLSSSGRRLAVAEDGRIRTTLATGTYYATVTTNSATRSGAYALRVLVRGITRTTIPIGAGAAGPLHPRTPVALTAAVAPASSGRVEIQVDRFDPVAGWQFSRLFHVTAGADGAAVATWTPPHVGRFRVRATFLGTLAASPSRSGYRAVRIAESRAPAS
jgi:hypothetical protein